MAWHIFLTCLFGSAVVLIPVAVLLLIEKYFPKWATWKDD